MDREDNHIRETYDKQTRETIRGQHKIGFAMMLRGFLAKRWMKALIRQGVPSPERKTNQLHEIIWTGITDPLLWQERNEIQHGKQIAYEEKEGVNLNNII